MLKLLSNNFYRLSSGPVALLALLIFAAFIAFVLPAQADRAAAIAGEAGSPDMSYIYSSADLYRMAEAYEPQGRAAYVYARFTFDLIFPLTYLFFLGTALSWVLIRAVAHAESRWRLLNLFPLFGALFDYLENITASAVMLRYPLHTPLVDSLAPLFTLIKWIFVNSSFVILIPAALIALSIWVRQRFSK